MTFLISLDDSRRFAQLSGDFNPLHLSPIAARRSPFGACVVHGVHASIKALLVCLDQHVVSGCLSQLEVWFREPIRHATSIQVHITQLDGASYRIELRDNGTTFQVIAATFTTKTGDPPVSLPSSPFAGCEATNLSLQQSAKSMGSTPLVFNRDLANEIFGTSAMALPPLQAAQLMAISRIVGMECPGLNSTLTHLKAVFSNIQLGADSEPVARYQAKLVSSMVAKLRLDVQSTGLSAKVESLYRPPPISQPSIIEIAKQVSKNEFSNEKCLVVGGSRGLGEVAAKILSAGGASIGLTYFAGRDDAECVREEIRKAGYAAHCTHWNVLAPPKQCPETPAGWQPDSIYYFATPHIGLTNTSEWNEDRFSEFCRYYVTGLVRSVKAARDAYSNKGAEIQVFYPSTVLLNTPGLLAAEYSAAKAASESTCAYLNAIPGVTCFLVRLPRILTDQTNSFVAAPTENATSELLAAFRKMHRSETKY